MLAGSIAGLCLLLCACSLEDDRDVCCGNIRMEISYVPYGVEEFATYIRSLRHFVFDAAGRFVQEIPSREPIRMLRFSLPDGDYTMLTLGNVRRPLAFEAGDRTLATLEMELAGLTPSGEYPDADELYWGVCRMHVDGSRQQTFTTRMNNIHCHLHIKVMWYNMPEDVGEYRMELGQVPVGYWLSPDRGHAVGDKLVPAVCGKLGSHVLHTPLRTQELRGEFVTMRYTAAYIPVFRLWFGDKAVTAPIDLARAFRTWGWNPDAAAVQEYRIQLTLFADGSVEVRPWIDADVEDWQNGGTFG